MLAINPVFDAVFFGEWGSPFSGTTVSAMPIVVDLMDHLLTQLLPLAGWLVVAG